MTFGRSMYTVCEKNMMASVVNSIGGIPIVSQKRRIGLNDGVESTNTNALSSTWVFVEVRSPRTFNGCVGGMVVVFAVVVAMAMVMVMVMVIVMAMAAMKLIMAAITVTAVVMVVVVVVVVLAAAATA